MKPILLSTIALTVVLAGCSKPVSQPTAANTSPDPENAAIIAAAEQGLADKSTGVAARKSSLKNVADFFSVCAPTIVRVDGRHAYVQLMSTGKFQRLMDVEPVKKDEHGKWQPAY